MMRTRRPHFIREWRKYRDLTQEQLAERIGWDRSHLSKIETGKETYHQAVLEALADELSCEPADLLARDPNAPEAEIIDLLARMDDATKRRLVAVARALKDEAAA